MSCVCVCVCVCWCCPCAAGNSFNDEERCLAAGYDNGDIKLFDLRANAIRYGDHAYPLLVISELYVDMIIDMPPL